jgi:EpsI family protein
MFLIGARWSEPEPAPPVGPGPGAAARNSHGAIEARLLPVTLAALFVLVLPHAALWGLQTLEQGAGAPRLSLPTALAGGWRSTPPVSRFEPIFNSPAAKVRTAYTSAAGEVGVYLAYYRAQSDGGKLVSSVNTLLRADDPDHNQVASGTTSVALDDGRGVGWRTAHILGTQRAKGQREQLTAWRSYWVDGRWVVGDAAAKLAGAYARLLGRGDDGAVLVLWTDNASQDEARALLEKFVRENLSAIETLLAQTRDQR